MKVSLSLLICAALIMCSTVLCDEATSNVVNCSNFMDQTDCDASSSSCSWSVLQNQGMCSQSITCSAFDYQTCLNDTNKGYCNQSGAATCSQNAQTCATNALGECNTDQGCSEIVKSCEPVGDWACSSLTISKGDLCSDQKAYCSNAAVGCAYNQKTTCPTSVTDTTTCKGPCTLGTLLCANTCSMKNPTKDTCEAKSGCALNTDGTICAPKVACSSIETADACNADGTGCQATYPCSISSSSYYSSYCSSNVATCTSDATVASFCSAVYSCEDNSTYCDYQNKDICGPTTLVPQCKNEVSCINPVTCTDQVTKETCPTTQSLCNWSDTTVCSNKATNSDCDAQSQSQDGCKELAATGCVFSLGGTCLTKATDNTFAEIVTVASSVAILFNMLIV